MRLSKCITLSVFLMLALDLAQAQSNELRLHVPFSFVVAGKELPAGEYIIERTPFIGVLRITRIANGQSMAVTSSPGPSDPPSRHPAATFVSTGGVHYLDQIHLGGEPARVVPQ